MGMMGSGWIWVVMDQQEHIGVVPTYGAGTILVRSRAQRMPRSYVVGVKSKSRAENYNPTLRRRSSPESTRASFGDPSVNATSPHTPENNIPLTRDSPDSTRRYSTQAGSKVYFSRSQPSVADARNTYENGSAFPSSSTSTNSYGRNAPITSPNYAPRNIFFVGAQLSPLFCVSVHEHAWMQDYGIWGKQEYLTRFWSALDWNRVTDNYDYFSRHP